MKKRILRPLPGMDLPFLILVLTLVGFGLVMLASASSAVALYRRGDAWAYLRPQLLYAALGLCGMWLASRVDYHIFHKLAWPLLCLVTLFTAGGGLLRAGQSSNTLVDFGALLGDGHHNAAGIGIETDLGGGVADIAQRLAHLGLHVAISLRRDFAEDQEHAGGGGGLHGHMAGRILGQQDRKSVV